MTATLRTCLALSLAVAAAACSRGYEPTIEHTSGGAGGAAAQCPVTRLEAHYYRDVADTSVPAEVGNRTCAVDSDRRLAREAECANQANTDAFAGALIERGLTRTEHQGWGRYMSPHELSVGQVIELAPEEAADFGAERAVYLGYSEDSYGCSSRSVLARGTTTSFVARDGAGALVVVVPRPEGETRTYVTCTCFPGCGREPPGPQPLFAPLGDGEVVTRTVEVPYPAITIVQADVESQTCCCAP